MKILELIEKARSTYKNGAWKLLKKDNTWINFIQSLPSEFHNSTPNQIEYHLLNNKEFEIPSCICGNPISFGHKDYRKFCSRKCSTKEYSKVRKKELEEKYGPGITNISQLQSVKDKKKDTMLERYGVENPSHIPEVVEKIKIKANNKTQEEKDLIEQKRKDTMVELYGNENIMNIDEFRDKIKETNISRYGVEYSTQSPIIQEKIKETNIKRYGVENVSQYPDIIEKISKTRRENLLKKGYDPEKYKEYHSYVCRLTELTYKSKDNILIENISTPRSKDWHLDHIYSIKEGFDNSIPPEVISSAVNLRVIPAKDNIIKNKRSDISIMDLLERYYMN